MTETRESTHTEWGTYEHDRDLYLAAMERTVTDLRTEIRNRMRGDWNLMNRAAFWRMHKADLAAIVAEWSTFERQNEREAAQVTPAEGPSERVREAERARVVACPPSWLQITAEGATQLASHLRVGLAQTNDAELRGFVQSFVASLEG